MVHLIDQQTFSGLIGNLTTNILPSLSSNTITTAANTAISSITTLADSLNIPICGLLGATGFSLAIVENVCKKSFADIPKDLFADMSDDVIESAKPLLNANLLGYEKLEILEFIAKMPQNERDNIIDMAKPLLHENNSADDIIKLIDYIAKIPENQRQDAQDAIHKTKLLLNENNSADDIIRLMKSITPIPENQRQDVVEKASLLIDEKFSVNEKSFMIETIAEIPKEKWQDIIENAMSLIDAKTSPYDKSMIIKTIALIKPHRRQYVVNIVSSLLSREDLIEEQTHINSIINNIRRIPDEEHQEILQIAQPLFNQKMSGVEKSLIMKSIFDISKDKRQDVIDRARHFFDKNDDDNNDPFATDYAFINDYGYGYGKVLVINSIANIWPNHQRDDLLRITQPLFDASTSLAWKAKVINAFNKIPVNERDDVMQKAQAFFDENNTSHEDKFLFIESIGKVPREERQDVLARATLFFDENMSTSHKIYIIKSICKIPENERAERVDTAFIELQEEFPDGLFPFYRIMVVLERQLNENLPPLQLGDFNDGVMAAAAAQGQTAINVHEGNRDKKTDRAMELLRNHTKEMSSKEIDLSVTNCLAYLKKGAKNQALFVLINPKQDTWGPLLPEKNCLWNAENPTSGREVVGRLWHFIQSIQDEKDKMNAIDSFISALNDCVDFTGERICPPGKVQRLLTAVLQGRLDGVKIDDSNLIPDHVKETSTEKGKEEADEIVEESIPIGLAMDIFNLSHENQGIVTIKQLNRKVKLFLEENKRVDSDKFLKTMKFHASYTIASNVENVLDEFIDTIKNKEFKDKNELINEAKTFLHNHSSNSEFDNEEFLKMLDEYVELAKLDNIRSESALEAFFFISQNKEEDNLGEKASEFLSRKEAESIDQKKFMDLITRFSRLRRYSNK